MAMPPRVPVSEGRGLRASGTGHMIVGTLVAAVAAYLFQLIVGRTLGPTDFAPITVLWTIQFLAFTIVFLPIEQLTIRRLNATEVTAAPWRLFTFAIIATAVGSATIASLTVEQFLDGQWVFVPITAALIVAYGLFSLGRGLLAGHRRFREYGLATLAESAVRLVLAIAVLIAGLGNVAIAWTLLPGALIVYLWRPFSAEVGTDGGTRREVGTGVALAGFVTATAAAQTLVAAGPLVVGALGAAAAEVSVFFETFLLFRAPLSVSYSLIARVLPPFTRMVESGRLRTVRTWMMRLSVGSIALAAAAYLAGHAVGPTLVEVLLGAEFRPEPEIAAYAASGVVLATMALFTQQMLIAMRATTSLATVWLLGVVGAAVTIAVLSGTPSARVGAGFLVGEGVATAGLVTVMLARTRGGGGETGQRAP